MPGMTASMRTVDPRLALAGVAMPIWFLAAATLLGLSRPDYDVIRDPISALGAVDVAEPLVWQIGGFAVSSVLLALLTVALWAEFGVGSLVWLVAIIAFGFEVSAVARCDAGCPPVPPTHWMLAHTIAGLGIFVCFVVLVFAASRVFRARPGWSDLSKPSLVLGCILVVLFVVGPTLGVERAGLGQRLFLVPFLAWLAVIGWRTYRRLGAAGVSENR